MRRPATLLALACLVSAGARQAQAQESAESALESSLETKRWYHASASAAYKQLAITDEDPRNDRSIAWSAKLTLDLPWLKGLSAYGVLGANQRFVAQQGELGTRLRDTELGAGYTHELNLAALELAQHTVTLRHRARVFLPTSFQSQLQDLNTALELRTNASVQPMSRLTAGADLYFQYRWHRYAEQAGLDGGMLLQMSFGPSLFAEYEALATEHLGTLVTGADVYTTYFSKYPSRESFESSDSSQRFWQQGYGWDVYAQYTPPRLGWLSLEASVGQGGYALRDGLFNVMLAHRDETEFGLTVTASY